MLQELSVTRAGEIAREPETTASVPQYAIAACSVIAVAVIYYAAARAGLGLRFQNSQISVVWPASAVVVSALLLTPRSYWWLVFAGTALGHMVAMNGQVPAWRWTWQIFGNVGFALAIATAVRHVAGLPLHFGSRRQVIGFTVVSLVLAPLFGLMTPAFWLSVFGIETTTSPFQAIYRTGLSGVTAILLITPALLLWVQHWRGGAPRMGTRRVVEAAGLTFTLLAVGVFIFGSGPAIAHVRGITMWTFPPLLWAAVRFGPRGAATALLFMGGLATWGSARALGPFVLAADTAGVLSLQLFWIAICVPVMLLAAVIHEREQTQDALQQQRNQLAHVTRVFTMGELSGAVAHDLRQPLSAILLNAQTGQRLLARDPLDRGELDAILHDIVKEAEQAAGVIAGLRSFLRQGESRFDALSVETVVRDALALGRSTITIAGVAVETDIADSVPRVRGDAVQLLQVVLNLVINACESMRDVAAGERRLRLRLAPGPGFVQLSVTDCGHGLPQDFRDRVFEPFFTTKHDGLGLGLTIGRAIAVAHGGCLSANNNATAGATFTLALPAAADR